MQCCSQWKDSICLLRFYTKSILARFARSFPTGLSVLYLLLERKLPAPSFSVKEHYGVNVFPFSFYFHAEHTKTLTRKVES